MLTEVQVEGFWRIAGGYSEASTFGGATIIALAFTFSYWRATNWRPALAVSAVLLLLLLLSTSSTGYASLAILVALLSLSSLWRLMSGRLNSRDLTTILAGTGALAIVLAVLIFTPRRARAHTEADRGNPHQQVDVGVGRRAVLLERQELEGLSRHLRPRGRARQLAGLELGARCAVAARGVRCLPDRAAARGDGAADSAAPA